MKKSSRSLYTYAAIVVVVAGYAFYDNWSSEKAEKVKKESSKILSFDKDQIAKLKLKLKTATAKAATIVELEKTVDGWKMLAPYIDQASNNIVEEFIDGISTEISNGVAAEKDIDSKAYGLDQPKAEFEVVSNQGKIQKIAIGSVKNFQGDAYLRINDDQKVLVASSTWHSKADKTAMEFRDRRLMRLSNAKTDKIILKSNRGSFVFEKKESGWIFSEHPQWKLDQNKVREFISKLNATEAIEFIGDGKPKPEELKKWGFDGKNEFSLQVFSEGKLTWSARIVTGSDKVSRAIVSSPEFILKMSPAEIAGFKLDVDQYRDRTEPFQFDKAKANKVAVKLLDKKIELEASDAKAKELLTALQKLELDRFEKSNIKDTAEKLENSIEVFEADGKSSFKFEWSKVLQIKDEKSQRSAVYAKSSGYSGNFSLLESEIDMLKLQELISDERSDKSKLELEKNKVNK